MRKIILFVVFLCVSSYLKGIGTESVVSDKDNKKDSSEVKTGRFFDLEPPDGKWLTDKNGRRYFIQKLKKVPGTYRIIGANMVKIRYRGFGIPFYLEKEDEEYLYVRIYDPKTLPPPKDFFAPEEPLPDTLVLQEVDKLNFIPFDRGLPKRGQWRHGFAIGDINKDGNLDLVFPPPRKGQFKTPVIFLGDGKGGWRLWKEAVFPDFALDYGDVGLADFDGNGLLDIVVVSHLRGIKVYVQKNLGEFQDWSVGLEFREPGKGEEAASFSSREVEVVDWNSDGKPDFVVLGEGPRLVIKTGDTKPSFGGKAEGERVYLNQGDGTWLMVNVEDTKIRHFGDSMAIGDLIVGNGHLEFIVASRVRNVTDILHFFDNGKVKSTFFAKPVHNRAIPWSVALVDSADKEPDKVVLASLVQQAGEWRSVVEIFEYSKNGWSGKVVFSKDTDEAINSIATGDLDGDGDHDLILGGRMGTIWILLNEKGNFVLEKESIGDNEKCSVYGLKIANLDRDGDSEVIISYAGEPGSEVLFKVAPQCTKFGRVEVWKVKKRG